MLSRRELLKLSLGAGGALILPSTVRAAIAAKRPIYGGWVKSDEARREFIRNNDKPFFADAARSLKGSSAGKATVLWPYYETVTKEKFNPFYQEIGDCVGEAGTLGAQFLSAIQIALMKWNEEWKGPFSVEYSYAASRVEIGGGKIRRGDGSTGSWMAEALQRYGLLPRGIYGQYDLTKYRPDLGRAWGRTGVGVPDELEPIAKEHPVKTATLVESWEQAADSISNGYPILLCSGVGYNDQTDRDGFLRHGRIVWYHAMLLIGVDRRPGKREGGCIANSWGTHWLSGPKHELGTPAGCFWADRKDIEKAIFEGDSFALSNYTGYPRRNLDYLLY